jgi:glycosyltransferase involved in cell wall biosynthesis
LARKATIITTCMGRLEHLKRTLPAMLRQECEVVVVDYSCPEQSGAWVEEKYPGVKVVRVAGQDTFSNWKARNSGAGEATGDLLIFCDADVVLRDGAVAEVVDSLPDRSFGRYRGPVSSDLVARVDGLAANQLRGFQVVPKQAFDLVGGYDEVLQGYAAGGDTDLGRRLRIAGWAPFDVDPGIFSQIVEHADADRFRNHRQGAALSYAASALYLQAKHAFIVLSKEPDCPLETRRKLYQRALAEARKLKTGDTASLTIKFSEEPLLMAGLLGFGSADRTLSVTVELKGSKRLKRRPRS